MNRRLPAAARIMLWMVVVGFAWPAAAEVRAVDASKLARCAAIMGGNDRLACYDALAVVAVPGIQITPATVAASPGGTQVAAGAAPGGTQAATGAAPGGAAAPAAGAAAGGGASAAGAPGTGAPAASAPGTAAAAGHSAPAARPANPDDPANFGLTRQQLKVAPTGPDSVKSIVSQMTEDRLSHVSLLLDNGQTWGFTDPNPRVRPGDSVTIKRAALGSFLLVTPSRHSYRVERLN
jgi:hypothetical protein